MIRCGRFTLILSCPWLWRRSGYSEKKKKMLPLLHFPGQTGLPRLPGARCFIPFFPFIMLTGNGYRGHPVGGVLCVCETPMSLRGFERRHQALDPQWGVKHQYFMTDTPLNLCQGRTGWSPAGSERVPRSPRRVPIGSWNMQTWTRTSFPPRAWSRG